MNDIYERVSGRTADLMFATRMLSPAVARGIVDNCRESSIATDVEWPLWAEAHGYRVEQVSVDGLRYRSTAEFDQGADSLDDDPSAWVDRMRIAMLHVTVLQRFIAK